MIVEFANWLATSLSLTLGTNLRIGDLPPDSVSPVAVIMERIGATPNFFLPDSKEWPLQFFTRGKDYLEAREMMESILNLISGQSGVSLTAANSGGQDLWISAITVINGPAFYERDERGRVLVFANAVIQIQDDD